MENKITKIDNIKKIKVIVSIVPRGKKEVFVDLIEKYKSNFSLHFLGHGTATDEIVSYLGIDNKEKDIILSFIREDYVHDCLLELEDKLKSLKNKGGIAFSLPLESIIGNSKYLFLANLGRSDTFGQ